MLVSWGGSDIEGMSEERFNAAKKLSPSQLLSLNVQAKTWAQVYEVVVGVRNHRTDEAMITKLVDQLTDKTAVRLKGTRRLIVWERVTSGELFFDGQGLQLDNDVFTVAGRANWALETALEKRFGVVSPKSSSSELKQLQALWRKHLKGETVPEFTEPYPSKKRGSTQIRSPQAIEALIHSLDSSATKSAHITRCLRDLYGLDAMPTSPDAMGRACNPDMWIHGYLLQVTPVAKRQSATWWKSWWQKNASNLVWDQEAARFVLPAVPEPVPERNPIAVPDPVGKKKVGCASCSTSNVSSSSILTGLLLAALVTFRPRTRRRRVSS